MGRGGKGAEVIEGALAGTLDPGAFLLSGHSDTSSFSSSVP